MIGDFLTQMISPALIVWLGDSHAIVFTGICSKRTCFEHACCPKPFVYSCCICHVFYVAIQIIGKYLLFINYLFINHLS